VTRAEGRELTRAIELYAKLSSGSYRSLSLQSPGRSWRTVCWRTSSKQRPLSIMAKRPSPVRPPLKWLPGVAENRSTAALLPSANRRARPLDYFPSFWRARRVCSRIIHKNESAAAISVNVNFARPCTFSQTGGFCEGIRCPSILRREVD
jgi:hypothetical protein